MPSPLAGPGVSSPTAATAARSTPVTSRTCANEAASDSMATSGPSRTRLGRSSMCSTRNWPEGSSTVALFMVPPLSRPTMNDGDELAIADPFLPVSWRQRNAYGAAAAGAGGPIWARGPGAPRRARRGAAHSANASAGGQAHTRFRSP